MSGRHFSLGMAAALLLCPITAVAASPANEPLQWSDLILTLLAFPVLTLAGAAAGILITGPAHRDRTRTLLRALAGALVGLLLTAGLAAIILARSPRDAGFVATAVLTLGVIPAGLIGLITGGLVSLLDRKNPPNP